MSLSFNGTGLLSSVLCTEGVEDVGEIDGDFVIVAPSYRYDVVIRAPSRHNARATSMSITSITAIPPIPMPHNAATFAGLPELRCA